MMAAGLRSLEWLAAVQCSEEGFFTPIGSNGFYSRGGRKAMYDQQPVEASGMVSAMISVMNRWVPRSMPLAQATTGVFGSRNGASAVAASRKLCAGVASKMMFARAAAAMSAVMPIARSMLTPGSLGFFRVASISAALSALRA